MDSMNLTNLVSSINRKAAPAPTRSLIDSWLVITGNLQSEGEIQVEGRIEGDIRCANLIVGKDANIMGSIIAEEVIVRGKVKGSIRANRVTLQDTAIVESDIYHKSMSIEQGACFEGASKRRDQPLTIELDQSGTEMLKAIALEMSAAAGAASATHGEDASAAA